MAKVVYAKKIKEKCTELLDRQVSSPEKLAITITLGICFGIIPVLGITTVLLAILAFIFRLNIVVIQLSNYLVYPLQLIFYIPFLKLGDVVFQNNSSLKISEVKAVANQGFVKTFEYLGITHVHAIVIWLVFCLPAGLLIYKIICRKTLEYKLSVARNYRKVS